MTSLSIIKKSSIKKISIISNIYNQQQRKHKRSLTRISFSPETIEKSSYNPIIPSKTKKDSNGNPIFNTLQLERSINDSLIAQKIGKFIETDEYKDFNEQDSEIIEKVLNILKVWNRLSKQPYTYVNFIKLLTNPRLLGLQKTKDNLTLICNIYNKIME